MPECRQSLEDATPIGLSEAKKTFDRHADLLEMSHSPNRVQTAMTVRKLQRDHGTRYVQELIESRSRQSLTRIRARHS